MWVRWCLLLAGVVPAVFSGGADSSSVSRNAVIRVPPDIRHARLSVKLGQGENNVVYLITGATIEASLVSLVVKVPLRDEEFLQASQEQQRGVRAGIYSFAASIIVEGKRGFAEFLRIRNHRQYDGNRIQLERLQRALQTASDRGWNVYDVKPSNVVNGFLIDAAFEKSSVKQATWNNGSQFGNYLAGVNRSKAGDSYSRVDCGAAIKDYGLKELAHVSWHTHPYKEITAEELLHFTSLAVGTPLNAPLIEQ